MSGGSEESFRALLVRVMPILFPDESGLDSMMDRIVLSCDKNDLVVDKMNELLHYHAIEFGLFHRIRVVVDQAPDTRGLSGFDVLIPLATKLYGASDDLDVIRMKLNDCYYRDVRVSSLIQKWLDGYHLHQFLLEVFLMYQRGERNALAYRSGVVTDGALKELADVFVKEVTRLTHEGDPIDINPDKLINEFKTYPLIRERVEFWLLLTYSRIKGSDQVKEMFQFIWNDVWRACR